MLGPGRESHAGPPPRSHLDPPLHGCINGGLGSPSQGPPNIGDMGQQREEVPHQSVRDGSSVESIDTLRPILSGSEDRSDVRQQYRSGLSEQTRGDKVEESLRHSKESPTIVGVPFHRSPSEVHSRQEECTSGCPKQKKSSNRDRMDPSAGCSKRCDRSVGPPIVRPLRDKLKSQAAAVLLALKGRSSPGRRCIPTQLEQPQRIRLSAPRSSSAGPGQSTSGEKSVDDINCATACKSSVVSGSSRAPVRSSGSAAPLRRPSISALKRQKSSKPKRTEFTRLEAMFRVLRKAGFSFEDARNTAKAIRSSSAKLYEARWKYFCNWCNQKDIHPLQASLPEIVTFISHLREDLKLSVTCIQGYKAALNEIFKLDNRDLNDCKVLSSIIKSFKKACSPSDHKYPEWDLQLVLDSLKKPPYEPLDKASILDVSKKTAFLLALASAKRVGEIHAFSSEIKHAEKWTAITISTLPFFVAKNQDPSKDDPRFGPFSVPALPRDSKGNRPLLCPVRAVKIYLKRTKKARSRCQRLFLNPRIPDKPVAKNTISSWIRDVIRQAHINVNIKPPDKIRAHSLRGFGPSIQFSINRALHQVLRAGTWASQTTFTKAYLRTFTVKYLDKFSLELGPVVAAQSVVTCEKKTASTSSCERN